MQVCLSSSVLLSHVRSVLKYSDAFILEHREKALADAPELS